MPTAQPTSSDAKPTPKRVFSVPVGRFSQLSPASVVISKVPNSPTSAPCCASMNWISYRMTSSEIVRICRPGVTSCLIVITPKERSFQVAPPSWVTAIAPQSPTAQAVEASMAATLNKCFSGGIGLCCAFQVAPPSVVVMMVADLPTAHPVVGVPKSTLNNGSITPLSRDSQLVPPSVVRYTEPKLPTATASVRLRALTP